ncbi:flagellar export protein FliJ [Piscinibacter sakaiensis]|uniref:Flagellar FliJ protein n=1 Tax=Piscinibacter sakaiensis TaxID=1547922 RepID=A0A0K8P6B5_PISS1|nr:flagellar export protein FliJ [Piscinibacter sakaiensis]GAP38228.1 flagellar protein FliJ [Piscinibacter sakaiensis]
MSPLQPLLALLALAEKERDASLAAHQQAQRAAEAAQAQSQQLLDYRSDYEQRWTHQFQTQGTMPVLHAYQGFMGRLGQAVTHQDRIVAQAGDQLARAAQVLREHELRVASVRKLIERRQQELGLVAERREQKATDEFAARAGWNRSSGFGADAH